MWADVTSSHVNKKMCNSVVTGVACKHGDKCRFSHNEVELVAPKKLEMSEPEIVLKVPKELAMAAMKLAIKMGNKKILLIIL